MVARDDRPQERNVGHGLEVMSPTDGKGRADLLDDGSERVGASTSHDTVRADTNLMRNILLLVVLLAVIALVVGLLFFR